MEDLGKISRKSELDKKIYTELKNAGIRVKIIPASDLGRASLKGVIGALDTPIQGMLTKNGRVTALFIRRNSFWIVYTEIPLGIANLLFRNPIGKKSISINGSDNHFEPIKYARPCEEEIYKATQILGREILSGEIMPLYNEGKIGGDLYISLYRIYTLEALNLFAKTMQEHGLAD